MKTVDYEAITNDMNEFYNKHNDLFTNCNEEETKAICMLFAAMNQALTK